jgi:CDP-glycerol glycerophosphotransferase
MDRLKKAVKAVLRLWYKALTLLLPVGKKLIVFESGAGRSYAGNPRAIYEEMVRRNLDSRYVCIWSLENPRIPVPGKARKVKRLRWRYFYCMARAGYWVFDGRHPAWLKKRKGTIYIQTWHGTPLKKLALDLTTLNMGGDRDLAAYKASFVENVRQWDILLSQNRYASDIFRRAFNFTGEMWEIGYPRNDALVKGDGAGLRERLGLPGDKKLILYAPTWRDDRYYAYGRYKFEFFFDVDRVKDALGSQAVLLCKPHYLAAIEPRPADPRIRMFPPEQDIQELLLVADVLVTDYSSVMFDFSILKRPMIFCMHDEDHYRDELRGFYFDLAECAPGPVVRDTDGLIHELSQVLRDESEYWRKYGPAYDAFRSKFNHAENGDAARKVVDWFERRSME